MTIVALGAEGSHRAVDRPWHEAYGVSETGAVLIRPDGHVAARFNALPADPAQAVNDALTTILSLGVGT
jgi:putative polyketide hydroxylase